MCCNLLAKRIVCHVVIDMIQYTHWQYFNKHPRRRVWVTVFILEMFYKLFPASVQFFVYDSHRLQKPILIPIG